MPIRDTVNPRIWLVAQLALVLFPLDGAPQASIPDFTTEWRWADFDGGTGFQGRRVSGMVEVGDTLWVRTDEGVFRYDGFHWWKVDGDEGIPEGIPNALIPLADGTVMVAVEGSVFKGSTEAFHPFSPPDWDRDRFFVQHLAPVPGGVLVIAFDTRDPGEGLFLWEGQNVRELEPPGSLEPARGLWSTPSGAVFLAASSGLFRYEEGLWHPVVAEVEEGYRFSGVSEAPDGSGLASQVSPLHQRGLHLWDGGRRSRYLPGEGEHTVLSGVTTVDGNRILLYETGDIRLLGQSGWITPSFPLARSKGLHYVFEDRLGNLWFASNTGLHLFRRSIQRWRSLRFPFPDPRNRVNGLLVSRSGDVWIATHGALGRMDESGRVEWTREILGVDVSVTTGLAEDSEGGIWVTSGATFQGAFRFHQGRWHRYGPAEGGPPGNVHQVFLGEAGALWFASLGDGSGGGSAGAYRLADGTLERWMDERGWLEGRAYSIKEAPDGRIWFGTLKGLLSWKEGAWTYWGHAEGVARPSTARVFTVLPDSSGGALAGFGPLARLGLIQIHPDGSLTDISEDSGLANSGINKIVRDPGGDVWVSSDRGVARFADGQWTIIDETVGLRPSASWPLAFRDGEVLMGTTGGGVQILSREEEAHPPPRIRTLGVPVVEGGILRMQFRVASYRGQLHPTQIQVRHRLPEREWSDWRNSHEITAEVDRGWGYGSRTVLIQAKTAFGGLSEPFPVEIDIPPPIWLRPAFFLPLILLTVVVLSLMIAGRNRKRRADEAIRESAYTLRTLVDTAPDGIAIYDADADRFRDVNTNVLTLTGRTREDFLSARLGDTSPERLPDGSSGREVLLEKVDEALAGKSVTFEWFTRPKDGPPIPVEMRLVRLPSETGRLVRFSVLDIRDRKEAEEKRRDLEGQLRQSQKLEAVGQLTGGVAHDFNNLLTVIIGNLDLLRELRGDDPEAGELINGALGAAERSSLLTQRLLAFSRRQTLDSQPLDVSRLLDGLLGLLTRSLGETIQIHVDLPGDLWPAQADPGQLEHALVNLAVNARDAMPAGGHLYLEAANVKVELEAADKWGGEPGEFVRVSMTDTGVGMDSQTRERAVEPFFTTKEVGAGSGLGLSMVYGFVKQSGGFIKIHSEVGRGTAVQIFLPRARIEPTHSLTPEEDRGTPPSGKGEVILVVEDEPLLLKLTTNLCEKLGYEVVGSSVAKGALDYINSGKPVDLLFSDVILPGGMDGIQLALKARTIRPNLPVLLTTGYAEQSIWRLARDLSDYELLSKPFDTRTLAWKLRGMLAD